MILRSHLYCFVAILIWSSLEITGKLVGVRIDPFTLTAWRFLIGGLVLLPTAIKQSKVSKLQYSKSSILHIASLGILNVCVSMLLLQLSIFYGKASLSAVIMSMNPVFVTFFAAMLLKERLKKMQITSLFVGVLGLTLMLLFEADLHKHNYLNLPLGISLAIASSILFGVWTVLTKAAVSKFGNVATNSFSFLFGSVILFVIMICANKPLSFPITLINLSFIAYLGLVITGIAYLLYFEGMKVISASRASAYFMAKPLIALCLSYLILKETITLSQSTGIILIVASLALPYLAKLWSLGTK